MRVQQLLSAIINGGELVEVFADFTGVDLNPISWNWAGVAFELAMPLQGLENRHTVSMQYLPEYLPEYLPDRAGRKTQLVETQQLALETFGA